MRVAFLESQIDARGGQAQKLDLWRLYHRTQVQRVEVFPLARNDLARGENRGNPRALDNDHR